MSSSSLGGRSASRTSARGTGAGSSSATGLAYKGLTISRRRLRTLNLRRAVKVTRALVLILALVVRIKRNGQLVLAAAHAVRAIFPGRSIVRDPVADVRAESADLTEELAVVLRVDGVADDAGEGAQDAGAELLVGGWRHGAGFGKPVGPVHGRTCARRVGGRVAGAVDACGGGALDLARVVAEVDFGGDGVAAHGDEAIVVVCFEVHVDDAAAPDVVHLRAEEDGDVSEFARLDGVAAVFGEEHRDGVVAVLVGTVLVSR